MSTKKLLVLAAGAAIVGFAYFSTQNDGGGNTTQNGTTDAAAPSSSTSSSPSVSITKPADASVHGVDLSHYQGDVNFSDLAADGLAFVYAKASEGERTNDAEYSTNKSGAAVAGLLFGSYHFYTTSEAPDAQATHFLAQIGDISGQLPPVVDVETAPSGDVTDLAKDVKAFVAQVQNSTGCQPIIYSNKSIWESYLNFDTDEYPLWLAEYSSTISLPKGAKSWLFWQHSQSGQESGVEGSVDTDVFNGTADELAALVCP